MTDTPAAGQPPGWPGPTEPPLPGPLTPLADESVPGDGEDLAYDDPDPRWRVDFHGLLYLGALRARFAWQGHVFRIRTLRSDEELIVAQLGSAWAETLGGTRAHAIAMVALCVESVDGKPMPSPIGEQDAGSIGWAEERFRYAGRWYSYTIDAIFERYLELEGRVREVMAELGKGSAPAGPEPGLTSTSSSPAGGAS
jgi:hypothetical protein